MTGRITDHEVVVRDTGEYLMPRSHIFTTNFILAWTGFWFCGGLIGGIVASVMGHNWEPVLLAAMGANFLLLIPLPFRARSIDKHHAVLAPRLSKRFGVEVTIVDLFNYQNRSDNSGGADHTHLEADNRFTLSAVRHPELGKNAPYTIGFGAPLWWESPGTAAG